MQMFRIEVITLIIFIIMNHNNDDDVPVQELALQLSAGSQLGLHTVAALATLVAGCQVLHTSAAL